MRLTYGELINIGIKVIHAVHNKYYELIEKCITSNSKYRYVVDQLCNIKHYCFLDESDGELLDYIIEYNYILMGFDFFPVDYLERSISMEEQPQVTLRKSAIEI